MAVLVLSDQDFGGGPRIIGLQPAVAAGQPLTFEQVGGRLQESATVTIPENEIGQFWSQDIARPGTTAANVVDCWFAPTSEDDENELDLMQGMTIVGNAGIDMITFTLFSPDEEVGDFKIKFEVS
jgi:hypothetical protein